MVPPRSTSRRYARFLLAYRLEISDAGEEEQTGRGWVIRIPDQGEAGVADRPSERWFSSLAELPAILEGLLKDAVPSAGAKRSERQ
jgi:hypothetical protein